MVERIGIILGVITFAGSLIAAIARTIYIAGETKRRLTAHEKVVSDHLQNQAAHRNLDSEERWKRVEAQLDRIEQRLNKMEN